ncbi:HmuY family protein [Pedobacter metabolipauper]|uniref:Heme-binding HmuY-like protein n=1 Tax=Pedobacter metabolipauper TaxID=425513 RepID=A0A4R6SV68_9SPHI|nr:HmuY family protein [Pedobacter metabolipauper]TDQ08251.1 heme-binding HmuY-like protein [Pedobacter metabolipauper]
MNRKLILKTFIAIASIAGLLSSCGKIYDKNGFDWEPDLAPSDSVFSREIMIRNLGDNLPDGHIPLDSDDPIYFSLEKFSSTHLAYKTTDRWDLAFHGNARGELSGNNGKVNGFGYGSSAIGGIIVTDSAYSKILSIPDDSKFQIPGHSGLDEIGFFGEPMGHVAYTFFGNIFRPDKVVGYQDNSYDPAAQAEAGKYAHMMYALSEGFAKAFPVTTNGDSTKCRTILVRTAAGNYAKVEILSYYKNTIDPYEMNRGRSNAVSFRYMVVKADEKRFGFTARRKPMTVNLSTRSVIVGQ